MIAYPLVHAATVTELQNVEILGTSYTVIFHQNASFNTIFDSDTNQAFGDGGVVAHAPVFWGASSGDATAVAVAVAAALGSDDSVAYNNGGDGFLIPTGVKDGNWDAVNEILTGAIEANPNLIKETIRYYNNLMRSEAVYGLGTTFTIATFEASAVSTPPTVFMLAPALFGLFGYSRSKPCKPL